MKDIDKNAKNELKKEVRNEINSIIDAIIDPKMPLDDFSDTISFVIEVYRDAFVPDKEISNNLAYDVKIDPFPYLHPLFVMNTLLSANSTEKSPVKLFNVLPLRTTLAPCSIPIDTTVLRKIMGHNSGKTLSYAEHENLWDSCFQLKTNNIFKPKRGGRLIFDHSIVTDGYSVGLNFTDEKWYNDNPDQVPKNIPKKKKQNKKNGVLNGAADCHNDTQTTEFLKVEDNLEKIKQAVQSGKKMVFTDPGQMDLTFSLMENQKIGDKYPERHVKFDNHHKFILNDGNTIRLNGNYVVHDHSVYRQIRKSLYLHQTPFDEDFNGYFKIDDFLYLGYHKRIRGENIRVYDSFLLLKETKNNVRDWYYFNEKNKEQKYKTLRYSKNQRSHELKTKSYSKRIETYKADTSCTIDETQYMMKDIERALSKYPLNVVDFDKMKEAIAKRNSFLLTLLRLHDNELFKKLKHFRYINNQKSEMNYVKRFSETFGDPTKVILIFGDYDANKGNRSPKGGPCASLKLKRLLIKAKYALFDLDEYRTSKLCFTCEKETELFKVKENHEKCSVCKIDKKKYTHSCEKNHGSERRSLKWGLKRCTNNECLLKSRVEWTQYQNRDLNACLNMSKIVHYLIETGARPDNYKRAIHNTNG
jgi:hypothetical protein